MQLKRSSMALIVVAAVMLSLVADTTFAKPRSHNRRGYSSRSHGRTSRSHRSSRGSYNSAASAYARLQRANYARAAAMAAARAEQSRASSQLRQTRTRLEREFKYSPEMAKANHAVTEAEAEDRKAKQRVLTRLASDREYRAALTAQRELHEQGLTLRRLGRASQHQIDALAKKEAAAAAVRSKIEAAALNADANFQQARQAMVAAHRNVQSLTDQFQGSVTRDPNWVQARKAVEQARVKVAASYTAGNRALAGPSRPVRPNPHPARRR